jgi:hypothetical protein
MDWQNQNSKNGYTTKSNLHVSNWFLDLNIKPEILNLLQEGAGNSLEIIGIGKNFLNRTPAAKQLRERMDEWDFIKLKSFYKTKEMVSKLKRPPTE